MRITKQDRERARYFEKLAHVLGGGHHDVDFYYPWQPEYHARMRTLRLAFPARKIPRVDFSAKALGDKIN